MMLNKIFSRGLKKIAHGRLLSVSRFRMRLGLPPSPSASGPLTDEPDWCYIDGTPGQMNKGQSLRYVRDQDLGRSLVKNYAMLKKMKSMRPSGLALQSSQE